jgi:hypothetical protein
VAVIPALNLPRLADHGLTEGMVISAANSAQYKPLLSPGLEWALQRGLRMRVIAPKSFRPPRRYAEATEKYSGQVVLSGNGLRVENYVAGLPFPKIDLNDPQATMKIMWNFYYSYHIIDDVTQADIYPRSGTIRRDGSLEVERAYIVDAYRKMNYTGRLYVDPKPELPNPEGVRFKESLHPIIEPFDLKGVGATFYRYLDPGKQDDSWIYLPQLRRVRRMSSAQRSDALFGQDTDADTFAGYNGHIAWMDFSFLGEKVMLCPMHAPEIPIPWQQPEDWLPDTAWEPRRMWVIEARSKSPQYAFSKRVLFIDQEAFLIPANDSYDRGGQLWKTLINVYTQASKLTPDAVIGVYESPMIHQVTTVVFDTQLEHATPTRFPATDSKTDTYVFNQGERSGVTEDFFSIAHLVATGR